MFNKAFLVALADHFRREGTKVIERVAKNQPAAYLKICALLVPKDFKVEVKGQPMPRRATKPMMAMPAG